MKDPELEAYLRDMLAKLAPALPAEFALAIEAAADAIATKIRHQDAFMRENRDICQTLAPALGYPRYCDDQVNFPGSTPADGYFDGEGLAIILADQAAKYIEKLAEKPDWVPCGRGLPRDGARVLFVHYNGAIDYGHFNEETQIWEGGSHHRREDVLFWRRAPLFPRHLLGIPR